MKCPRCGKKIPEDALFCPECGTKISRVDAYSESASTEDSKEKESAKEPGGASSSKGNQPGQGVICPNCGSANLSIERFTWWGGMLGAAIANRLKCKDCGHKFKLS